MILGLRYRCVFVSAVLGNSCLITILASTYLLKHAYHTSSATINAYYLSKP